MVDLKDDQVFIAQSDHTPVYNKPKLVKHDELRQITFSAHDSKPKPQQESNPKPAVVTSQRIQRDQTRNLAAQVGIQQLLNQQSHASTPSPKTEKVTGYSTRTGTYSRDVPIKK